MSDESDREVLSRFGRAFFRADRELLDEATTVDFEWGLHFGPDAPSGRVLHGSEETLREIERRKKAWSDVRYTDVEVAEAEGGRLVQTFRVSGVDENGQPFDARGVDLYRVRDGRVASKDSYWKRVG